MPEISIVARTTFANHGGALVRLDAEYVRASALAAEGRVAALSRGTIGTYATLGKTYRGRLHSDVLYDYIDLDAIDTRDGLTHTDQMLGRDLPSRAKWLAGLDCILVGNVRPVRKIVAMLTGRTSGALASSGFTALELRQDSDLPAEYLFAFLRSRFGRLQLIRREAGSMYPAVRPADVLSIHVPWPPDLVTAQVVELVRSALQLNDLFFALHADQATAVDDLLSPFGPAPDAVAPSGSEALVSVVSRAACFGETSAARLDAEFFRADYAQYQAKLVAHRHYWLGQRVTAKTGRIRPKGSDVTATLKQSVLTNAGINWSAVVDDPSDGHSIKSVNQGDVLLAATAHEIPYIAKKVDFVRAMPPGLMAMNQAVAELMILRPRTDAGGAVGDYLAAFLRSPAGRHQIQRCIRGLRGGHVYPADVTSRVVVHEPDETWLAAFESRAERAERARSEGIAAIAGAVRGIEKWLQSTVVSTNQA